MMHSPLSRTPRSTRSEPPKTLPASPLLQPPQPCPAEILGEGQTAATIPTPGGAQESPGSPACSPAPSPRHRQETTAAACGQLITVTQPHPACTHHPGAVPTPAAPQAQRCTHTVHNGSPRAQCHPAQSWGLSPTARFTPQDTPTVVAHGHHAPKCPSMLLAHHADPCLVCSSNMDMAGESQSRVGEERVA